MRTREEIPSFVVGSLTALLLLTLGVENPWALIIGLMGALAIYFRQALRTFIVSVVEMMNRGLIFCSNLVAAIGDLVEKDEDARNFVTFLLIIAIVICVVVVGVLFIFIRFPPPGR